MSFVENLPHITMEAFLALPGDEINGDLIEGRLWEDDPGCSMQDRWHSAAHSRFIQALRTWLDAHDHAGGEILSRPGFRLAEDTAVGIDVAYVSDTLLQANIDDLLFDGAPALAVEILSGSDRYGRIVGKIKALLKAGCLAVWIIDPYLRTISIYRAEQKPMMVNDDQDLSGDDYLPGFLVPAARIFGR